MLAWRLQCHKIDHVDDADLNVREMLPQQMDSRQRLEGRDISRTGHHNIRFAALVSTCPLPNSNPARAVFDGVMDVEVLRRGLLACDNYVDVMPAAQAMICDRQQRIRVWRKIHAN